MNHEVYFSSLAESLPGFMDSVMSGSKSLRKHSSVFHYTSRNALYNMLLRDSYFSDETSVPLTELFAGSAAFLNDSSEFDYGLARLRESLSTVKAETEFFERARVTDGGESASPSAKLQALKKIERALGEMESFERGGAYCVSFSASENDLSQWRSYGSDGNGVCLQFDRAKLEKHWNGIGAWVIYDETLQREAGQRLISRLSSYIQAGSEADFEEIEQLKKYLAVCCLYFKHPSFSAEKEFRLIWSDLLDAGYPWETDIRFKPATLHRFAVLKGRGAKKQLTRDPQLPLERIIIGPTNNRSELQSALQAGVNTLLKAGKLDSGIEVVESKIPYLPG